MLKGRGRMLKGMGVLIGRGMEEWWASSPRVGDPSLSYAHHCVSSIHIVVYLCSTSSLLCVVVCWCVVVLCPCHVCWHPASLPCCCSMVSVSSTCVVVSCAIIVMCQRMMTDVVVHHLVVSEGSWNESGMWLTKQKQRMMTNVIVHCWLPCCHQRRGTWIPHEMCVNVSICEWSLGFVGSRFGSWAAIGVRGRSVSLYLIVGIGCCVVVVVGVVVVWWLWWLLEERKNVTCCDISVMFKLTHKITWIFSCDNYIFVVNTPNPGLVLVFAGPVRWTGKKTEIGLNPTAKDWTTGCGCTNSEFFRLPVAMFVKKSKNRKKPV